MKWFRRMLAEIISQELKKVVKDQPKIISNIPPKEDDIYHKGTIWTVGETDESYLCTEVTATWKKKETFKGDKQ